MTAGSEKRNGYTDRPGRLLQAEAAGATNDHLARRAVEEFRGCPGRLAEAEQTVRALTAAAGHV